MADEPTYIDPVAVPLSRGGPRRHESVVRRLRGRFSRRAIYFAGAMAFLGGVLAFVVISLPGRIDVGAEAPVVGATDETGSPASATTSSEEAVPPYRAQQIALAREAARDSLGAFVDLQLSLESDYNIAAWGAAEFARVKDRANAADALFIEEDFDAAIAEYAGALADLEALAAVGEARFEDLIAAGLAALADHAPDTAASAFDEALAMRPDDARARAGRRRAEALPAVLAELREAERAALRDDHAAATRHLAEARRLDPETTGLGELSAEVASARIAKRREARLSEAFAALSADRYEAALAAFDTVLKNHPGLEAALAGRQQAVQAQTRARIDELQAEARAAAKSEDWELALAKYDAVLAIDSTLKFAREGKAAVRERVMLIEAMEAVLQDPGRLSSDQEFAAANATLRLAAEAAAATGEDGAGARFAARVAAFRELVEKGAQPVALVLLSDNATEVTIHKVGPLGAFDRHEVALRPGRYVIVGSQDGCRDVRKEIVLESDMPPVDIRCAERI